MREIKFRGIEVSTGEFVYGKLLTSETNTIGEYFAYISRPFAFDPHVTSIPIVSGTEGQFTGLKDKNGAEIYEGDIIQAHAGHPEQLKKKWKIVFIMGAFGLQEVGFDDYVHFMSFAIYADRLHDNGYKHNPGLYIEVLGNQYQNQDLLQ